MEPFFIVISGTSGSGKTTLCKKLATLLGNDSVCLSFDEYFAASEFNLIIWYTNGANPDEVKNAQLLEDLHSLRTGKNIKNITTGETIKPSAYILLDEPFGRGRYKTENLIDFSVHLELPLEVSLARRILRHFDPSVSIDYQVKSANDYLTAYLKHNLRDFYVAVNAIALEDCDVSLDGMKSTDELALEVVGLLSEIKGGKENGHSLY
ncbi:AAA family ATPase [Paenibacillus eucommiae]|uniref:Uridine kinase n=1 Tax=Paenibacillus eucommiae TaxID=1355755 RepID=A0ABS4J8E8_9BACL|nr:AAA family ATPase [Paenibacillus eucommiae]MBP1995351.1 uridine kinase [Paenibacillus eucommiae]